MMSVELSIYTASGCRFCQGGCRSICFTSYYSRRLSKTILENFLEILKNESGNSTHSAENLFELFFLNNLVSLSTLATRTSGSIFRDDELAHHLIPKTTVLKEIMYGE